MAPHAQSVMETQIHLPLDCVRLILSHPVEHVLLITLNRPEVFNTIDTLMGKELESVFDWFEREDDLFVAIITGAGNTFTAGGDLQTWAAVLSNPPSISQQIIASDVHGTGSLSRRKLVKPIIAAVNGNAYGGGVEMVLNCDIVVASEEASFTLPEVKRGLACAEGGIPRLVRVAGHQFASEMLLLGAPVSAEQAQNKFGFVNFVVRRNQVLPTAIKLAKKIASHSPDSIRSTKEGLLIAQEHHITDTFFVHNTSKENTRMLGGKNLTEGLNAFAQKRRPVWKSTSKM